MGIGDDEKANAREQGTMLYILVVRWGDERSYMNGVLFLDAPRFSV